MSALAERDACEEGSLGLVLRPDTGVVAAGVAGGGNLPLQLAELMLMCLASPSRSAADAALDYFASVNTVGGF